MNITLIPQKILGTSTIEVLFREVAYWGTERGLNPDEIQKSILECGSIRDVNKILEEKFDGEIKVVE